MLTDDERALLADLGCVERGTETICSVADYVYFDHERFVMPHLNGTGRVELNRLRAKAKESEVGDE